jgi:two-component system, OmpR family, manganese sensing sensor histidine kinase
MDQALSRSSRLITDLLFLARSEAQALPVRSQPVRIAELAAQALRELIQSFEKHAQLTTEIDSELMINTDPDLLIRLLLNLLENALHHTPQTGSVCILANKSTTHITIEVRDTGIGIAPEVLARLGEPFYRSDTARDRQSGGAGLGLALCQGIAHTLGGTLTLESAPGQGTCATLRLPV